MTKGVALVAATHHNKSQELTVYSDTSEFVSSTTDCQLPQLLTLGTHVTKPWSQYRQVVVETYEAIKAGKSSRIHVRPIPGETYPTSMDVECSRPMREQFPVGTRFRIYAKETCREGGKPFLYSRYDWPYEIVE